MTDTLFTLFAEVLEKDIADINDDVAQHNTPQWDSLTSMHLVAAIETTFNIHLSTQDILKMDSIGKVRQVLQSKNVVI